MRKDGQAERELNYSTREGLTTGRGKQENGWKEGLADSCCIKRTLYIPQRCCLFMMGWTCMYLWEVFCFLLLFFLFSFPTS